MNLHEFSDSATYLVEDFDHQLMAIILDRIEELLEFLNCQIANGLTKMVIFRRLCSETTPL